MSSFAWEGVYDTTDSTTPDTDDLAAWQAKAGARFPEVAALTDLMNGDSESAVMSLAADMAARVKAGKTPADSTRTPAPPTPAPAPTTAEMHERLKARARGDGIPNSPEDRAAWAAAKLREAAGS